MAKALSDEVAFIFQYFCEDLEDHGCEHPGNPCEPLEDHGGEHPGTPYEPLKDHGGEPLQFE